MTGPPLSHPQQRPLEQTMITLGPGVPVQLCRRAHHRCATAALRLSSTVCEMGCQVSFLPVSGPKQKHHPSGMPWQKQTHACPAQPGPVLRSPGWRRREAQSRKGSFRVFVSPLADQWAQGQLHSVSEKVGEKVLEQSPAGEGLRTKPSAASLGCQGSFLLAPGPPGGRVCPSGSC